MNPTGPGSVTPAMDLQQEIRFGIVLYGGVSLAIYINGVTQELLRLVRSTAPADPAQPSQPLLPVVTGSEAVYRKLGQILGNPDRLDGQPCTEPKPEDPIQTRFLIDVIAGTSAGGINGVFLGKALALNQNLDEIKQLWIHEGDIGVLLNDEQSLRGIPKYDKQDPPQSLLNSQRMYLKLLKALSGMDRQSPPAVSPLADELDVFITATDLSGLVLPLQLSDGRVFERKHRAVFQFAYAGKHASPHPVNQFTQDYTPFQAFAARCTSAFPLAFEPMQLSDIDEVLKREGILLRDPEAKSSADRWRGFYPEYDPELLRGVGLVQEQFPDRAFADGGYLDNKPFGYVIDKMLERRSELHMERKLLYLEPDPDAPERQKLRTRRPDAIDNSWLALTALPRYETIRGDLERVLARNREVERIRGLFTLISDAVDIQASRAAGTSKTDTPNTRRIVQLTPGEWAKLDTLDLLELYGRSYVVYHRLKVASVSDTLNAIVAEHFRIAPDSENARDVRYLIDCWRDMRYGPADGKRDNLNQFLLDFDVDYRRRRLRFVQRLIDALYRDSVRTRAARFALEDAKAKAGMAAIRADLNGMKRKLRESHRLLRTLDVQPDDLVNLGDLQDLKDALRVPATVGAMSDQDRRDWASHAIGGVFNHLEAAAQKIRDRFRNVFEPASAIIREAIDPKQAPKPELRGLREFIYEAYMHFEEQDATTFPITYNTGIGEIDQVDILRVSPMDAKSLIDEEAEMANPNGMRKLRGADLGAFAGFLDREWRENDMLWGRLDGAERIICALLPRPEDESLRAKLIAEAQDAILTEELAGHPKLLAAGLVNPTPRDLLRKYRELLKPEMQRDDAARALTRTTTIIGKLLEDIATHRRWQSQPMSVLARIGRVLWYLVEVAAPNSLADLIFRHWIKLVYFAGVLLLVIGLFLSGATRVGATILLWTAGVHLAVMLTRDYLIKSRRVTYALATLGVVALLILALIGGIAVQNVIANNQTSIALEHMRWIAGIGAGLAFATLATGLWMQRLLEGLTFEPGSPKPYAPLLQLEQIRNVADVENLAGDTGHHNRAVFRRVIAIDGAFLTLYALLFVVTGILAGNATAPWIGWMIALPGVGAAVADLIENAWLDYILSVGLRELCGGVVKRETALQLAIPAVSRIKCSLAFSALGVAGAWLLGRAGWSPAGGLEAAAGAWALLAALVGGLGTAGVARNRMLSIALLIVFLTLALTGVLYVIAPPMQ